MEQKLYIIETKSCIKLSNPHGSDGTIPSKISLPLTNTFLTHTVQMEPAKFLLKNKIAYSLFYQYSDKYYTKLLKNLQVEVFFRKPRYTENILLYFIL